MDAPRPNFFIVGAPKSGTTALYHYLRAHPEVFMPEYKEPHYFAPDLESYRYVSDEARYLSLFEPAAGVPRVGESSVYYLYSEEAARRIHAFAPEAKIIVMLRNPTDMIYSLHSQRLFSGHEDIGSFAEALDAEPARREGKRIPENADPVKCLLYTDMGRYTEQVRRFFDAFGRESVHVILYDDFAADTLGAYHEACTFLGVDPSVPLDDRVHNPNKTIRSQTLRDLTKFSPGFKRAVQSVLPRPARQWIAKRVYSLNTRYEKRAPLEPALRARLARGYAQEVRDLSDLLGRDLTGWTASDLQAAAA